MDGSGGSGTREAFARDVRRGLGGSPRTISSRWFYDAEGSRIFREIMALPEYYLTGCELEILERHRDRIAAHFDARRVNLVELGAGDGTKTRVLLRHLLALGLDVRYVPIDISAPAIAGLARDLRRLFPGLPVAGIAAEYFAGLAALARGDDRRTLVLFLGSSIGNLTPAETRAFLRRLRGVLRAGDLALIGFDLRKDPRILLPAYDDAAGVTARFNLNLLARVNRELGADFRTGRFGHRARWNGRAGAMESHLVSRVRQRVTIDALRVCHVFAAGETIHTEISRKYRPAELPALAAAGGFEMVEELRDRRGWFADALWRAGGDPPAP